MTSDKKVFSEWILVTPAMAKEWLARNVNNRPLSSRAVDDISDRMTKGEWLVTGQGLSIDVNGNVLDGQHRLAAICDSGKAHQYLVTFNLPENVFDHTDVGGKGTRTASDLLSRRLPDLPHRHKIAAVAGRVMCGLKAMRYDKVLVVDFVEAHHELLVPITLAAQKKTGKAARAAVIAAFVAAARSLKDTDMGPKGGFGLATILPLAQRFGEMSWQPKGDPLKALYCRLNNELSRRGATPNDEYLYALGVAALRADLAGKRLEKIEATAIDWDDDRSVVPINSAAFHERMSLASKAGWERRRKRANGGEEVES